MLKTTMKNMKQHPSESSLRQVEPGVAVTKLENSHRRRLKIRRMKYSCKAEIHVGNGTTGGTERETETKLVFSENERREIHESVEISLSLASSLTSEEEDRTKKRNRGVLSHGLVSLTGKRKEMEDAVSVEIGFAVKESSKCDFFAVYDGHGGAQVAEACRERLHRLVAEEVERCVNDDVEWEWERVMEGCFSKMDNEVAGNSAIRTVGSTAVVTVVAKTEIVVANCGDSRAVLGRGGQAVDLSNDHKVYLLMYY